MLPKRLYKTWFPVTSLISTPPLLSHAGTVTLILEHCRKPIALEFLNWIFHLPTIFSPLIPLWLTLTCVHVFAQMFPSQKRISNAFFFNSVVYIHLLQSTHNHPSITLLSEQFHSNYGFSLFYIIYLHIVFCFVCLEFKLCKSWNLFLSQYMLSDWL